MPTDIKDAARELYRSLVAGNLPIVTVGWLERQRMIVVHVSVSVETIWKQVPENWRGFPVQVVRSSREVPLPKKS